MVNEQIKFNNSFQQQANVFAWVDWIVNWFGAAPSIQIKTKQNNSNQSNVFDWFGVLWFDLRSAIPSINQFTITKDNQSHLSINEQEEITNNKEWMKLVGWLSWLLEWKPITNYSVIWRMKLILQWRRQQSTIHQPATSFHSHFMKFVDDCWNKI